MLSIAQNAVTMLYIATDISGLASAAQARLARSRYINTRSCQSIDDGFGSRDTYFLAGTLNLNH